jgi:hypothetical protein
MPKIALIACANGLGHIRRMLSLSLSLRYYGARVVMFAPKSVVMYMSEVYSICPPDIVDFESRSRIGDWFIPMQKCWSDDLPALDSFDEIVCDNLIEVLDVNEDAWLSGSFFWHLSLPGFPTDKSLRANNILERVRPRMISSSLFAAPYLEEKTRLTRVGLYKIGEILPNLGQDILLACGRGGRVGVEVQKFLNSDSFQRFGGNFNVWIEPEYYQSSMPSWVKPASFTPAMYAHIAAAVIRPGVGTVTDALVNGARLFLFYESENFEMEFNAACLKKFDVGEIFGSIQSAWRSAVQYIDHEPIQRVKSAKLSFNGSDESARLILSEC